MSDLSFGKIIIDKTSTSSFIVRKKNDTGNVMNIDTTSNLITITGDMQVSGNVDGRDISNDGGNLDNLTTVIGLTALTSGEVDQLENINTTTVSSTQWGYLGGLDQELSINSSVEFHKVVIDSTATDALNVGPGNTFVVNTSDGLAEVNGKFIIDGTNSDQFVVRKAGGGEKILEVDSLNSRVRFIDSSFYNGLSSGNPFINFDSSDVLLYDRTNSEFQFKHAGVSGFIIGNNTVTSQLDMTIDRTSTNTLIVRKGGGGDNILRVDTINSGVSIGPGSSIIRSALSLYGTVSSIDGPSVMLTTTQDSFPVFHIQGNAHDSVWLNFDCYWNGTNDISSDAGSNFRIGKDGDSLNFRYDSGKAQGSSITSNTALSISSVGNTKVLGEFYIDNGSSRIRMINSSGVNWIQSSLVSTTGSSAPLIFSNAIGETRWMELDNTNLKVIYPTRVGTTVNLTTSVGGALNLAGDLVLGSTTPRIYFPADSVSYGPPTFTNRSIGTKIVLWSSLGAGSVDYAIGIGSGDVLWNSVPTSSNFFKWYGGTTEVMSLSGSGVLNVGPENTLIVDSLNSRVRFIDSSFYNGLSSGNPFINFDSSDVLLYDRTNNEFNFRIGSTNVVSINKNEIVIPEITILKTDESSRYFSNVNTKFNDNVLSYYDFSDSTNLGKDFSGRNLQGSSLGITHIPSISSRNNSVYFNQANSTSGILTQRIDLSEWIDHFKSLNRMGISAWFKTTQNGVGSIISFSDNAVASTDFAVFIQSGKLKSQIRINGTTIFQNVSTGTVNDNNWHNVIVNIGFGTVSMYLDNVEINNYTAGNTNITTSLSDFTFTDINIGASRDSAGYEWGYSGYLADVIMFNQQISTLTRNNLITNNYGYDVYALMGQSNMVGRSTLESGIDDNYSLISGKVFQFPYDANDTGTAGAPNVTGSTIIAATNQLDHISDVTGGSGSSGETAGTTGLWKTFVESIVNTTSARRRILLVPLAKGNTGFSSNEWNPTNLLYVAATQSINRAMILNSMNSLKAILWHQGERDASIANSVLHGQRLNNFYNNLLIDITDFTERIPFICGGIQDANKIYLNPHLQYFSKSSENKYYIDTDSLETSDGTHFDTASIRLLGKFYASVFKSTLNIKVETNFLSTNKTKFKISDTTTIQTTVNPSTSTGGALDVDGDLVLGATNPRIYFPTGAAAFPTFTNRSSGTKIVLWPSITASAVDYAIGVGSGGASWCSVPTSSNSFTWYGGTTEVMNLQGDGILKTRSIEPLVTGTYNLGTASKEWLNIYSQNAITVSDRNKKSLIVPEILGLDFIKELEPSSYIYKSNGAPSRGLIAQDLEKVCERYGINGLVSKVKKEDTEEFDYGIMYTQLFSILIKSIQELSEKVKQLEG
jgi:hypothetical protein